MSVAVSVKVHDGVVLASDSASTLFSPKRGVGNVYNNANKIFNLYKGLPIGGAAWGVGAIGKASMATLAKDLRSRFEQGAIDRNKYQIEEVASQAREFLFEHYQRAYEKMEGDKPSLGFLVAGYSANADLAEEWVVAIDNGQCLETMPARNRDPKLNLEETGITWGGEPEAITRLVHGHGTKLPLVLSRLGIEKDKIDPAVEAISRSLLVPLAPPPMPIQDAIDLAKFLVQTTISFSRFKPGPPTVGGPIEIAAITKHEHFKWVSRKHYYSQELNPREFGS